MSVDMGALWLFYGVVVVFSVLAVWYVKLTSGALVPKLKSLCQSYYKVTSG